VKKILLMLLVGCGCKNASDVTRNMYPGLTCFGHKDDYALCVNQQSEEFVCFASEDADTAFCLRAVPVHQVTRINP